MNPKTSFVILTVAAAIGIYMVVPSFHDLQDYDSVLPSYSTFALVWNSPSETIQKVHNEKTSPYMGEVNRYSLAFLGFKWDDPKAYEERGISIHKPCGIVVIEPTFPRYTCALFLGIHEQNKFKAYLQHQFAKNNMTCKYESIQGYPCLVVEERSLIFCVRGKTGIAYVAAAQTGERLRKKFIEDILSTEDRLKDDENFTACMQNLEAQSDFCYFLNYQAISPMLQGLPEDTKGFLPKGLRGISLGLKLDIDKLVISNCLHFEQNSETLKAYSNEGSSKDIVQNFPENPLFFSSSNSNMEHAWKKGKQNWQEAFPRIVQALKQNFGAQMEEELPQTPEEALAKIQDILREKLRLDIDIEKDIVANLQGNAAVAVYPASTPGEFPAVTALKLKSPEKMYNLIKAAIENSPSEEVSVVEQQLNGNTMFSFTLQEPQPFLTSPALGICRDYLIITTTTQMAQDILQENSENLFAALPATAQQNITEGDTLYGFLDISQLYQNYKTHLPLEAQNMGEIVAGFKALEWNSKKHQNAIQNSVQLQTHKSFVETIVEGWQGMK